MRGERRTPRWLRAVLYGVLGLCAVTLTLSAVAAGTGWGHSATSGYVVSQHVCDLRVADTPGGAVVARVEVPARTTRYSPRHCAQYDVGERVWYDPYQWTVSEEPSNNVVGAVVLSMAALMCAGGIVGLHRRWHGGHRRSRISSWTSTQGVRLMRRIGGIAEPSGGDRGKPPHRARSRVRTIGYACAVAIAFAPCIGVGVWAWQSLSSPPVRHAYVVAQDGCTLTISAHRDGPGQRDIDSKAASRGYGCEQFSTGDRIWFDPAAGKVASSPTESRITGILKSALAVVFFAFALFILIGLIVHRGERPRRGGSHATRVG